MSKRLEQRRSAGEAAQRELFAVEQALALAAAKQQEVADAAPEEAAAERKVKEVVEAEDYSAFDTIEPDSEASAAASHSAADSRCALATSSLKRSASTSASWPLAAARQSDDALGRDRPRMLERARASKTTREAPGACAERP